MSSTMTVGRRLGRGLASLIPDTALDGVAEAADRPNLRMVPLDEIRPNPAQPRQSFDAAEIAALADSIRQHGVLSPLLVRREGGHYVLIAGERRMRAAAMAGLSEVPVIVRDASRTAQLELALVENLQRSDLPPLDAAKGYDRLIREHGLTQDDVARRVGRDRATVANAIRLLVLPDFAQAALQEGRISAGHARALLPLEDHVAMRALVDRIAAEGLSVRATERAVAALLRPHPQRRGRDPHAPLMRRLGEVLHTRVAIRERAAGGGRIVIDFSDRAELERLASLLAGQE